MSDTLERRELVSDTRFEVRATSATSMIQCWQACPTANRRTLMEILGTGDGPAGDSAQGTGVDDNRTAGAAAPLSLIHISEPTRLGMISYAVFCLKKKKKY